MSRPKEFCGNHCGAWRGEGTRDPRGRSSSPGYLHADALVSVVIPTLNEAENLPHVLGDLPSNIYEGVIVGGHSTGSTVEVARAHYPSVRILSQSGRGTGNACGFAACQGDIIVMLDVDCSQKPQEIPKFLQALEAGADSAKESRFLAGGGSADTHIAERGNSFFTRLARLLYGTQPDFGSPKSRASRNGGCTARAISELRETAAACS